MPRPSIIIGVGGTGVEILSWIKKNLLETYGSMDDIPVRILLVDVVEPDTSVGRAAIHQDAGDNGKQQHDLDLDREFVQLARDTKPEDIEMIKRGLENGDPNFEHFNWYCNGFFPIALEHNLRDGAGQLRQLGLLAMMQGIHWRGADDILYSRLRTFVREIGRNVDGLDIHITGSFAGGTGSGIFMHLAFLVRKLVEEERLRAFITGFFAMPEALADIATESMSANAFSAWRELNRMMMIRRQEGSGFVVRWGSPQGGESRFYDVERPIFDHVYLAAAPVEGRYRPPERGLFPMMGEAISFFIDSESGNTYVERIRQNLESLRTTARYRNKPTYSTFYVRTWKLPVFHSREHRRHIITEKVLQRLLHVSVVDASAETLAQAEVENESATGLRRGQVEVGNMAKLIQLADTRCGDRVVEILTGDMSLQSIGNTGLIADQDQWRRVKPSEYLDFVGWFIKQDLYDLYIDLPETDEGTQLLNQIRTVMNFALPTAPDSRKKDVLQGFADQVHAYIYGDSTNMGEYQRLFGDFVGEQQKGQVYEVLAGMHAFHVRVFRQRLTTWTAHVLNEHPDGMGGLACIITALEKLRFDLTANLNLLEMAQSAMRPVKDIREECNYYYEQVMDPKSGGVLPGILSNFQPVVKRWLDAEHEHLREISNRRALRRMVDTQREMLRFVEEEALPKARTIEAKLVTGNRTQQIRSVYEQVYSSLEMERQRSEIDRSAEGVVSILNVPQEYDAVEEQVIDDVMTYISWKVTPDHNIQLVVALPERDPITLDASTGDEGRRAVQAFTRALIREVAGAVVQGSEQYALDQIRDIPSLLRENSDISRLLYRTSGGGGQPDQAKRTFYLKCAFRSAEQGMELERYVQNLDISSRDGHQAGVVGTENLHKVVTFHALEMLHPEDFDQWNVCYDAYWKRALGNERGSQADAKSVRCSHLFNAEKNAFTLEHRFVTDRNYADIYYKVGRKPIFTNRVVHPLEYQDRVMNFLKLWAMGFVQEQRGTEPAWLLAVPGLSADRPYILDRRSNETDILGTLTRFVYGREDLRRTVYSHFDIANSLKREYEKTWLGGPDTSLELQKRFEYESQAALEFAEVLTSGTSTESYEALEGRVRNCAEDLSMQYSIPSRYLVDERHITLAEIIAEDAVEPNNEAGWESYLQMLQIVLPVLYDELVDDVKDFRKRNRWT